MTDEIRDNLLISIVESLNKMDTKFEEYKLENNNENILKRLEKIELTSKKNHQEVLNELERQRINTASLEYNLTDKIRALFDVREINNDKFKEHDKILKNITQTLDSHNRRILKLEKAN